MLGGNKWNLMDPNMQALSVPQGAPMAQQAVAQGGMGGAAGAAALGSASAAVPYLAAADMGIQGLGTLFDIYGAFQAADKEEAREDEQRREMEFQRRLEGEERQRRHEAEDLAALYKGANYSGGMDQDIRGAYSDYFRRVGA